MKAKVDAENHQLVIKNAKFPLSKYFPSSLNFQEQRDNMFTVCTTCDGTFLVEDEINLTPTVTLQPGLYEAKNNQAMVHLSTAKHGENVDLQPLENETLILDQSKKCSKLNIPTNHLNREEKRELMKALRPFKDVFFKEDQKLSFTHEVKHRIDTNDEKPIHQKTYKYPYHLR